MRLLHTLQWRVVLAYTALIVVSMGAVSMYLVDFVRGTYISNLEERLEQEAGLVGETTSRYFLPPPDIDGLQVVSERIGNLIDARVTVIALDGTVLTDTWEDPAAMENHALRPEVQGALRIGLGKNTRTSATVGREMLYTAAPIKMNGTLLGVARVAVPTSRIQANVNRIIATIFLSAAIVTAISLALGYLIARRAARSIRSVTEAAHHLAVGEWDHRVEALSSDETQELAEAFNSMASALRNMVHELSGERDKLSAVLGTMADGVVVIGPDGQIELLNPAGQALLGVGTQDHAGERFMELVRDHELQHLVSLCQETGQRQFGEVELVQQGRFLSAIATPLTENGSPGVLLTLHDLTRIRQVETTRKEFVSNVSHELRSPLASMKAMAETLDGGALDDQLVARDFVRRIHGEIDRMSRMVEDILDLARLESEHETLRLNTVHMGPLLEEIRARFQQRADAKGIKVEVTADNSLPGVLGDEDKLRQVLANLLDNALNFTPESGTVTLSADADVRMVKVSVSDSGIGIPDEHLPHIFERFYKVDRARGNTGSGLGLAIIKHIVQAHGGEVAVESREGDGSTFSLTLPRST